MNIQNFFSAVLRQDAADLRAYFEPNAQVRWHCSNECFTVEEYIRANCEYPGDWDGELERIEQAGDTIIAAARVWPRDKTAFFHVVSFIRLRDGLISEMDEYWSDDGPAPGWRQEMGIGERIR